MICSSLNLLRFILSDSFQRAGLYSNLEENAGLRPIAYARVSTAKQGRSGLGLEAQEAAIASFLKPGDSLLAPLYVEVESGKRSDRPELAKALAHAKLTGATLLVAKLDRLARNVSFLLSILGSGVDVAFCDLPHVSGAVGRFMVQQMASVAELEAGLISERTKAALAAAKERGTKLGGFRGVKVDPAKGLAERKRQAGDFAARVLPVVAEARKAGAESLREIAAYLTAKGVQTRRGGPWDAAKVRALMLLADSDDRAQAFRFDAAQRSDLIARS